MSALINPLSIPKPKAKEDDDGFFWNYRIVNLKSENGGDNWYCMREVYYNEQNKKPFGHCEASLSSETMKGARSVGSMMMKALKLPPMQEEDFK
jgi:hypothetical protein